MFMRALNIIYFTDCSETSGVPFTSVLGDRPGFPLKLFDLFIIE